MDNTCTRVRVLIRTHYNGKYGRSLGERNAGDIIEVPSGAYTEYLLANGLVRLVDAYDDPPFVPSLASPTYDDVRDDTPEEDYLFWDDPDEDTSFVSQQEEIQEAPEIPDESEKPARRSYTRRKKADE